MDKSSYLVKYNFSKHHEHEVFVFVFYYQVDRIEPPGGQVLGHGPYVLAPILYGPMEKMIEWTNKQI